MLDGTGTQEKRNVDSENGTSATAVRRRRTFLRFEPEGRPVPREVYEYESMKSSNGDVTEVSGRDEYWA